MYRTVTYPYLLFTAALALNGCFRGPGFMKQEGTSLLLQKSNVISVETQDVDGVITASLSASSNATQAIAVTSAGALAGSSVAFPPGSLSLDTKIDIQEAAGLSTPTTATQLGLGSSFTSSGAAVMVKSSVAMDATKPFTLAIPLPSSTGLFFGPDLTNLAVLYKVAMVGKGQTVMGLIPKTELRIEGDTAVFSTKYFGAFQSVLTETLVQKVSEVATTEPILTKLEAPVATESTSTTTETPSAPAVVLPTMTYAPVAFSWLTGSAITPVIPTNSGGPIESCSTSVPLPAGLTLADNCDITGTPTSPQGPVSYAIVATNSAGTSAPFIITISLSDPAPQFSSVTPTFGGILGGTAITINGTGFQAGAAVTIGGNACSGASVSATTITCTTPSRSEGTADIQIVNPDAQVVLASSAYTYINQTISLDFQAQPPTSAVINSPMPTFSVRAVREDGTTDSSWSYPAAISGYQWSGCGSGGEAPGILGAGVSTSGLTASGGVWTYPNVTYDKQHALYFKIVSGPLTICSSTPVTVTLGACDPGFPGIAESEGNMNLDYIATCRRPSANTNDIPFATAIVDICNVGWHACYPSEYSNIQRANLGINDITTNSNTTYLNTEGTLNDGSTSYYYENNAGTTCALTSGSQRIVAGAQYWKGWTIYDNGSTCASDGNHNEVDAVMAVSTWRPAGYRFMYPTSITSGDGAVCCRNTNPQFTCASKATQPTCDTYSSACVWSGSSCDPL